MRRAWTKKEDKILRDLYSDNDMISIQRLIKRSDRSIYTRAKNFGLHKSPEYMEKINQERNDKLTIAGKKSRFNKGHEPHNQGKTGIRVSPKSEYKKGNLPSNTLYDGAITVRNDRSQKTGLVTHYKYIRIRKAVWVLYQRYVWEQRNGKIPRGYVVRFKDGDTMNCDINNLECISMAENASRNANREKAKQSMQLNREEGYETPSERLTDNAVAGMLSFKNPEMRDLFKQNPELIELKRAQLLLNRKIRNHEKQND